MQVNHQKSLIFNQTDHKNNTNNAYSSTDNAYSTIHPSSSQNPNQYNNTNRNQLSSSKHKN
jgi:hypothetical protein